MADGLSGASLPPTGPPPPGRPGPVPPGNKPSPPAEGTTGETPESPPPADPNPIGGLPPGTSKITKPGKPPPDVPAPQKPGADRFTPYISATLTLAGQPRPPTPGQVTGVAPGQPAEVTGQGTAGPTARYENPDQLPPELKNAFEALAKAPFGTKIPAKGAPESSGQALFKQYQMIPHELLKRSPAAFLFLNTVVGRYAPSEIRRMAEKNGVDLAKVVTALVLEAPAQPEVIARLAGEHRLGAERSAVLKQAEQLANSPDPLQQLAGRFTKTVLGNNQLALQAMLTDPVTFFTTQLWNKLAREQQSFMTDGRKTRSATGMLQRGGLGARGLGWVIGEHEDEGQRGDQGGQGGQGASELQQQKAFYDNWRETLIKGIKDSADAKAGYESGPPTIEMVPTTALGASRAVYDPVRKAVRLGTAFPECVRVHTHGLTLTVAPDGELLEIALRDPQHGWELKRDLAPPVVAGLDAARARVVAPKEGATFPTHDRFYTSADRNVIYLQVEKRPVARRALAAANVLLDLDENNRLLGIMIWQLSASKVAPPGDKKAWIAGLSDRAPGQTPGT